MARRRFIAWNFASPTTGEPTFVTIPTTLTTGATLLQIKPASQIAVIEWGYQTSVVPTAFVNADLLTTGTVGATVTAYTIATDVVKYDDAGSASSTISSGTAASGFTSSAEGTIAATRLLDKGPGWSQYYSHQFPLDREPGVQSGDFLRARFWSATALSVAVYVIFEE